MISAPQPLADHHQLVDFDSGEPSLDDSYLMVLDESGRWQELDPRKELEIS